MSTRTAPYQEADSNSKKRRRNHSSVAKSKPATWSSVANCVDKQMLSRSQRTSTEKHTHLYLRDGLDLLEVVVLADAQVA